MKHGFACATPSQTVKNSPHAVGVPVACVPTRIRAPWRHRSGRAEFARDQTHPHSQRAPRWACERFRHSPSFVVATTPAAPNSLHLETAFMTSRVMVSARPRVRAARGDRPTPPEPPGEMVHGPLPEVPLLALIAANSSQDASSGTSAPATRRPDRRTNRVDCEGSKLSGSDHLRLGEPFALEHVYKVWP